MTRPSKISKGKLRESGLPASMKESAEGSRRVGGVGVEGSDDWIQERKDPLQKSHFICSQVVNIIFLE